MMKILHLLLIGALFLMPLRAQSLQVEGSTYHTLMLCPSGYVYVWGNNEYGQLGLPGVDIQNKPARIPELDSIVQIRTGYFFSVALRADGTVWTWGTNINGILGNGSKEDEDSPVKVEGISNVVDIQVNRWNMHAVKEDGALWGWGNGKSLGNGSQQEQLTPIHIDGLENIKQLETRIGRRYVLTEDGNLWVWGNQNDGALGNGVDENETINTPQRLTELPPLDTLFIEDRAAFHNFALDINGDVWGWGQNHQGQIGDGSMNNIQSTPVRITELSGVKAIYPVGHTITSGASLALTHSGVVYQWGYEVPYIRLPEISEIPKPVPEPTGIEALYPRYQCLFWLTDDRTLLSSGRNTDGILGTGSDNDIHPEDPIGIVQNLGQVKSFYTNDRSHAMFPRTVFAHTAENTLYGWGNNQNGQIGDTTFENRNAPVPVFHLDAPGEPDSIEGPRRTVTGEEVTYSINPIPEAIDYEWKVPDDWEIIDKEQTTLQVKTGNRAGEVCVLPRACKNGEWYCISVAPEFTLGEDTVFCEGGSLTLNPIVLPEETIAWSTGDSTEQITIEETGTYWAVLSVGDTAYSDTIEIHESPRPKVYISPTLQAFCGEIDHTIIPETKNAKTFQWNTGDTTKTLYVDEEGVYWLRVESEYSCANADTTEIIEVEYPESLQDKEIVRCESYAKLDAGNPEASHLWSTGERTQTITVEEEGLYSVEISNAYCSIEEEIVVKLNRDAECPYLWMPNAFSPNNDGLNDVFKPVYQNIENFRMVIYNRWGQRLFETDNITVGWDGMINGEIKPEGSYVYKIRYSYVESDLIRRKHEAGSVTLVR